MLFSHFEMTQLSELTFIRLKKKKKGSLTSRLINTVSQLTYTLSLPLKNVPKERRTRSDPPT